MIHNQSSIHPAVRILIVLMIVVFVGQSLYLMHRTSPVTDAIAFHLVNGYSYLKTQDFRMSPATPPLIREWMVIPWLFFNPVLRLDQQSWQDADSVPFALSFFYGHNRSMADILLLSSRLMVLLLSLLLMACLYLWARQLYGTQAAMMSLVLYCFSPTIIGYSSVVNVELGISLCYFVCMFLFYRHWEIRQLSSFPWLPAVFWGLALASKYTGVLLGPIIMVLCIRQKGMIKGLIEFFGIGIVSLLVVWSTYFFEFGPLLYEGIPRLDEKIGYVHQIAGVLPGANEYLQQFLVHAAGHLSVPLPTWILGFAGIVRSHNSEYLHFFMGHWGSDSSWYHYFVSFVLKVTIPALALISLRLLMLPRMLHQANERVNALYLLTPVGIIFILTTIDSTGVGMRYLVPALPFLFLWVGGLWSLIRNRGMKWVLVVLIACHVVLALCRFPHYIAYFNEFIGGPKNAHRIFRANDLEWGQGLIGLSRYIEDNNIQSIRTQLFGVHDASFYGIPSIPIQEIEYHDPKQQLYAISVFNKDRFKWTQQISPIDIVDHVIWIYDLRGVDVSKL